MDFSSDAPQQKGKFLKKAGRVVGKVIVKGLPVASQFVPALRPVAAIVGAIRQ
jgi:hypothetical protein